MTPGPRAPPGSSANSTPISANFDLSPSKRQRSDRHDRRLARYRRARDSHARLTHRCGAGRRGDRDLPYRQRQRPRAGQSLPAQARPAEPGHRPRRRRRMPTAQFAGSRSRPARCSARTRVAYRHPGPGRCRPHPDLTNGDDRHGTCGLTRWRRSARPAPIAVSAAASSATPTGDRSALIAGDPAHPANTGRLCSKGTHPRRNHRPGKSAAPPDDRQAPRLMGQDARPRRAPLPQRSHAMARTASPSTSPANC